MLKVLRLIFTFMLVLTAAGVNAQVTTSAISGKVTDEQNETVIGATIVAVHEPSGTQYGAITNVDGRYTIQGMRTGGPYKLTVSYVGYQSAVFTGIMLELGNTYTQNVKLHPSSELLDEVVVVADAKTQSGAATNFSANSIENTPTVDRNIYDIVKNSPLAMTSKNGGITFVAPTTVTTVSKLTVRWPTTCSVFLPVARTVLRQAPILFLWMPFRKFK